MSIFRQAAVLAAIESSYGTDATPAAATHAMMATQPQISPVQGDAVTRDRARPDFGKDFESHANIHARLSFSVELGPSPAAGSAPAYGPLLRACGFSETIQAGVSVTYAPVSAGFESASLYFFRAGKRYIMTGARGRTTFNVQAGQLPFIAFEFLGLVANPETDVAVVTPVWTNFRDALIVNRANTTFALGALSPVLDRWSINIGQNLQFTDRPNLDQVRIVDRDPAGEIAFEQMAAASLSAIGLARANTRYNTALTIGTQAGARVRLNAPALQLIQPTEANANGITLTQATAKPKRASAANDEFTLVFD